MWNQMLTYFREDMNSYLEAVYKHMFISSIALIIAILIAIPFGVISVKYKKHQQAVTNLFGALRLIPSLAILILFIPIFGTGLKPALVALTLLAIPPILMNTVAGLEDVPDFVIETAFSCGMTSTQVWRKIRLPLALPMILAGIKIAAIEVIASATLAAKIGAGGLGEIIFTGLGLNRTDFLLIGGISVAILSGTVAILFDALEKKLIKYKN